MEKEVAETWDKIWENMERVHEGDSMPKLIFSVLMKEIVDVEDKKILEVGSGTGLISLMLAKNKANVTLMDISINALRLSSDLFNPDRKADMLCATMFKIPFRDNSFDVVWNAGVLEHFSKIEQIEALTEMNRVCKKDGMIITLNPYRRAILYRIGKWYAEKTGKWEVGYEKPIESLKKHFREANIVYKKEYSIGFYEALKFFRGYIPYSKYPTAFLRKFKNIFNLLGVGGYLLVSIGKK